MEPQSKIAAAICFKLFDFEQYGIILYRGRVENMPIANIKEHLTYIKRSRSSQKKINL